jgi:hypothetical protein
MAAPPRPVPTASGAAAGELIVPTARRHRVPGLPPLTGLSPAKRPTVAVVVPEGVALTTLLPAAEDLLQSLAKVEAATPPANRLEQLLPAPLAGRVALAALYRLWDTLDQQLRPSYGSSAYRTAYSADSPPAHTVCVPTADLAILDQAAHTLTHPTDELTTTLGRVNPTHCDALTQLLAMLATPSQT